MMPTDGEIRELNASMAASHARADSDNLRAENERLRDSIKATGKRLSAENARLQDGYDSLKCQYDEEHDKLLGYKARDKVRGEALEAARQFILEKHGICLALVQLDEVIAMTPEEALAKED